MYQKPCKETPPPSQEFTISLCLQLVSKYAVRRARRILMIKIRFLLYFDC